MACVSMCDVPTRGLHDVKLILIHHCGGTTGPRTLVTLHEHDVARTHIGSSYLWRPSRLP